VRLKACGTRRERLNVNISIPFGAIKRVKRLINLEKKVKFQFLLVRLKVTNALQTGIV